MKLKTTLLLMILENQESVNRYSKAYINLQNVFELEEKENFSFTQEMINSFKKIKKKYNSFLNNIPLKVVESYFFSNADGLDTFIFIDYNDSDITMKAIEIKQELEMFFEEIFKLSCEIANYYNLEIKLNNNGNNSNETYYA